MRATFNKMNDMVRLSQFYEGIWGNRGLPPLILNLSTRRKMVILMPWLLCPLTEQKAGYVPEMVWMFLKREKSVVPR